MKRVMNASEMARKSHKTFLEKYGREKYSEMGKKSAELKKKNDPDYFKRIRAIGIAKQKEAKKPINKVVSILIGEK